MILIKPSYEILYIQPDPLKLIELAGRTCYKSEDKITEDSAEEFVRMIIKREHLSVIEHASLSVRFICDRGVTHELVRHRLCAFSQESTRYCNYKGGVTFIIPPWLNLLPEEYPSSISTISTVSVIGSSDWTTSRWFSAMSEAENTYTSLLEEGWSPQQARSVLPNSVKTEIIVTANLREWRHIFNLRCSKVAHPQMREIMIPLLEELKRKIPVIFDDVKGEAEK